MKSNLAVTALMAAGLCLASAGASFTQEAKTEQVSDRDFVAKAAVGGSYEVHSSQLALKQGSDDGVKKFAQQMITDHTKANKELLSLAGAKRLPVPKSFDPKHQEMFNRLKPLQGADFDREYVKQQDDAHREAVSLFEAESENGQDADLKAFAKRTLPTLQHHHQMIRDMAGGQDEAKDEPKKEEPKDEAKPEEPKDAPK